MHVAIVTPEFPPEIGGMQTYALEFAAELAGRGHRVTVFTRKRPTPPPAVPGVEVRQVLSGRAATDLPELLRVQPDAWHAMNAAYAWIALHLAPVVVSIHGNDFLRPYVPVGEPDLARVPGLWRSQHWRPEIERRVGLRRTPRMIAAGLRRCRHILANSRYTERVFLERYPECRGRTSAAMVGVGADFLAAASEPAPPRRPAAAGAPTRLVTVCRLSEERKNVGLVLQALAQLAPRHEFEFTVVGDGDLRPALEQQARDLGIAARVVFTGFLPAARVGELYAGSDLFVLTAGVNPVSHEGFGIAYLEANACGTPTLAARLAGAAEAVEDGVSGYFAEPLTVAGVAAALERFFKNEVRFSPQACREFARRFTWAKVVDAAWPWYAADALRGMRPVATAA